MFPGLRSLCKIFFSPKLLKASISCPSIFKAYNMITYIWFVQKFLAFDLTLQSTTVAQLIHQVDVIGGSKYLIKFNYVFVFDLGKNVYFVTNEFIQLWKFLEFIHRHLLDCHFLPTNRVLSTVDAAVATFPKNILQDVVLYLFAHFIR